MSCNTWSEQACVGCVQVQVLLEANILSAPVKDEEAKFVGMAPPTPARCSIESLFLGC